MYIVIVILIIVYLIYRNSQEMQKAVDQARPKGYDALLKKLCYLTKKSTYEIFEIAGERYNLPKYMIKRDFDLYLKNVDDLPDYVKEFLEEGEEYIREAIVSPFVFTNWGM